MERFLGNLPKSTRRTVIAIVGGCVVVIGLFMVPLPGPGWLVVFMGLAILAQEYPWAKRVLHYGRQQYDKWSHWIKQQNRFVQSLTFIATCVAVVVTLWLINGYGLLNTWLHLGQDWLNSPFLW